MATARSDFLWVRSWTRCEAGLSTGEERGGKEPCPAPSGCTLGTASCSLSVSKCPFPLSTAAVELRSGPPSAHQPPKQGWDPRSPAQGQVWWAAERCRGFLGWGWEHIPCMVGQSGTSPLPGVELSCVPVSRAEWGHPNTAPAPFSFCSLPPFGLGHGPRQAADEPACIAQPKPSPGCLSRAARGPRCHPMPSSPWAVSPGKLEPGPGREARGGSRRLGSRSTRCVLQ